MRLKSALMLLAAGSLLPLCIFALLAVVALVDHERDTMERESRGRVVSAMSAVDAELRGSINALQALGASKNLEMGDIKAFYEESRRVLVTQPYWRNIGLSTVSREQLMDTILPLGANAPFGDDPAFDLAIKTGKAVVSDVRPGTAVPAPSVRLRLPITVNGSMRYVLSAPIDPAMFKGVLAAQQVQRDWVIALIDRSGQFIARIPDAPSGGVASAEFKVALERSPQGWFRGRTLEGRDTFTPYITSPLSGWVLGIAIPASTVDAPAKRTFGIAAGGMLVALACAIAFAWLLARRVAAPISSLASAAQAMAGGRDVELGDPGRIAEVRELHGAMHHAIVSVQERQKSAESEKMALEREQRALQSADKAKDEFIATLSHELRNPLGALTAAMHLLKKVRLDNDGAIQARDIIERQLKQMSRLVEDLLDVSRIVAGKADLEPEVFDASECTRQLIEFWRASGRFAGHEVAVRTEPAFVYADRARTEQVLSNLLDNALKYTPRGGKIHVTSTQENGHALIKVEDDGAGIDREDLGRIFDLFAQGGGGVPRNTSGLGIGLAMVKRLTELQGGTVEAWSAGRGKGSVFAVSLPATRSLPSMMEGVTASGQVSSTMPHRRILMIDDNDDMRRMVHAALVLAGHEVSDAGDGTSGVAIAAQTHPEVVFVDIGLPDVDGYEVARRIRAQPGGNELFLIAVSGYGQPQDRSRAIEAGFDLHLTKPISIEALEQAIVAVAETRSARAGAGRAA